MDNNNNTSTEVISGRDYFRRNERRLMSICDEFGVSPSQLQMEISQFLDFLELPPQDKALIISKRFKTLITNINPIFIYLLIVICAIFSGSFFIRQGAGGSKKQKSKKSRKLRKSRK
jgi:hypothetical protein